MVANEDTQASEIQNTTDNTGAFEKLKQTLSSSLLTAQDKGKFPVIIEISTINIYFFSIFNR